MSSEWAIAGGLGVIVGVIITLTIMYLYKKYLADTAILAFMIDQFKLVMKKQFDDLFPTPPKEEAKG